MGGVSKGKKGVVAVVQGKGGAVRVASSGKASQQVGNWRCVDEKDEIRGPAQNLR